MNIHDALCEYSRFCGVKDYRFTYPKMKERILLYQEISSPQIHLHLSNYT